MKIVKKVLLMALSFVLVAAISVGATLAFLADTDSDVNVMTVGNVKIDQVEYERADVSATGTVTLRDFTQAKPLDPAVYANGYTWATDDEITGTVPGGAVVTMNVWKDIENEQDKFVFVKNIGMNKAYLRTWFAFELGDLSLTEWGELFHINANTENWDWSWNTAFEAVISDVKYVVVCATYKTALASGAIAAPSLLQYAMDEKAGNETVASFGNTYDILVFSQAVQTTGFSGATEALNKAFKTDMPWEGTVNGVTVNGETVDVPVLVSTATELTTELANGGMVILANDIVLADAPITLAAGTETVLNLNGHTLEGRSTSNTTSNLIKVSAGASLTLSGNGTVSFTATTPDTDWGANGTKPFPGYANNTINCAGKLVIDGVTVVNKTAKGGASYAIDCYPGADVTVNSGVVDGVDKNAIRMFANSATVPTNVTINGGTVKGSRAVWVQLPGSDATAKPPVNLTVNGGKLVSLDTEYNLAIYSYSYGNDFSNTSIALNGGEYFGNVALGGGSKNGAEKVTVNTANCTFYGEVYSYNDASGFATIAPNATGGFVATNSTELAAATKVENATVYLAKGVYENPSSFKKGSTIIGGEGVVFTKTLSNTMDDVTIKDVKITAGNAQRWSYAKGTVVFEGCTFEATGVYAIHYDGTAGANITYKDCEIIGWVAIAGGADQITFENCTIKGNGTYGLIRSYAPTTIKNCTFDVANVNTTDVYQDGIHAVDTTIIVENCTNVNGAIEDLFNVSGTGEIKVQ